MAAFDVLIAGAGMVGAACAAACAAEGLRVCIVEPATPGAATSGAGMGHVVAMDDSPEQLALTRYGQQLWRDARRELPSSVEYEECGTLWVAADEQELHECARKAAVYAAHGVPTQMLSAAELLREEPNLRPGLAGALLVPEDGVVYPPRAASYFVGKALKCGAELVQRDAVVSVHTGGAKLRSGRQVSADRVIVATGSDTTLCPSLPVHKRKGHLVITDRYPGFVHHQLVELGYLKSAHKLAGDSVAFNIQPRRSGQLLVGSSRQSGNESAAADQRILRLMLERAQLYMPGLRSVSALRVWTGFRAATPDKLPYLGATQIPGVYAAMGFEGLGITEAPAAARLLADAFTGRVSAIDASPYSPARVLAHA